ncbi:nuclear transport factor 2 family protein [Streptomyces sp. NRRL S-340]|uniref:nuclear transport factor 2 family protein n=1 Tax=Streptomyces sp. NRRL S-340 TaxID=1463901 RepID=UPI00056AD5DA|nr:nuclear transport factor 2 family protein [Streptomyces sp. NRRL S-340]
MTTAQSPRTEPGQDVAAFVQHWYDILSSHEPVEDLLPHVIDDGLEMAFPERTLRSHADFRDWYAVVGESFGPQSHIVEKLRTHEHDGLVDVEVTVVWTAKNLSDGSVSALRIDQTWQLVREGADGALRIRTYHVGALNPA